MNSWLFAVVIAALWVSPVVLVVVVVWVGRRFGVDLRRHPPPDDVDYTKW